jgi:hypothetical protein
MRTLAQIFSLVVELAQPANPPEEDNWVFLQAPGQADQASQCAALAELGRIVLKICRP